MTRIFFLFTTLASLSLSAQNLVPNGGFEHFLKCPAGFSETQYLEDWKAAANTPDFFAECAPNTGGHPLYNWMGSQQPRAGQSMGGLLTYTSGWESYRGCCR